MLLTLEFPRARSESAQTFSNALRFVLNLYNATGVIIIYEKVLDMDL